MDLIYRVGLMLCYPTSICVGLVVAGALLRKRTRLSRACLWGAVAVLMVCGNGWIVRGLARGLERQYLPLEPMPHADSILILSGGIHSHVPPRPTVEVDKGGDRVLYGAYLYRQGIAPMIICTGGVATGAISLRTSAEDMAELLLLLGVPKDAIITETQSSNTREHARNLNSLLVERGFRRVLLVTSAMHMPRAIGVFRRLCPAIEFTPAPTDFRIVQETPMPWHRQMIALIPTPDNMTTFMEAMHEYVGMSYYRIRKWM